MTNEIHPDKGEVLVYQASDGAVKLDVRLVNESLWMTQSDMARLFRCSSDNISLHVKNIYDEGELSKEATTEDFSVVRPEGKRQVKRTLAFYNLDMIISVGYRVKSLIATRFRIWATHQLKEYIIKGFVMDDERLKNPPIKGSAVPDYFDEMLERIRDIRASEKRMYLRVGEIFAIAADYEPSSEDTALFFKIIQNKLHFASTGMTAAELIRSRSDNSLPNMGLVTWKGDEVRETDVVIARNYLTEIEIHKLNRIVKMWLDFSENQARRRKQIFMSDWEKKLDDFLKFIDRDVLPDAGTLSKETVSKEAAADYARKAYNDFAIRRRKEKESVAEQAFVRHMENAAETKVSLKTAGADSRHD